MDPKATARRFCCVRGGAQVPDTVSHAQHCHRFQFKVSPNISFVINNLLLHFLLFYLLLDDSLTPSERKTTVEI